MFEKRDRGKDSLERLFKGKREINLLPSSYYPERTGIMHSYTLEQVKAHSTPDDVWIILHNKSTYCLLP
jgi:hypothetical protein